MELPCRTFIFPNDFAGFCPSAACYVWVELACKTPPALLGRAPCWRCNLLQVVRWLPDSQLVCSKSLVRLTAEATCGLPPHQKSRSFRANWIISNDLMCKTHRNPNIGGNSASLPESRWVLCLLQRIVYMSNSTNTSSSSISQGLYSIFFNAPKLRRAAGRSRHGNQ